VPVFLIEIAIFFQALAKNAVRMAGISAYISGILHFFHAAGKGT
jgi:hypothetical protein